MFDPNTLLDILGTACKERKVCRVRLEAEPEDRLINPHGVCYSNKGKMIVVCILVKGYTESGNPANFRNLFFEKIREVEILPRRFVIDPNFNPHNAQYKNWLFHVMMK